MLSSRSYGGVVSIDLVTGGKDYTQAPTVSFSGGGGAGCTAVCHMAGTRVESVVIVNQGAGYTSAPSITLNAADGSGAAAEARVSSGTFRPMSFFQGRFGDVYGVDGMGRGVRWDTSSTTAEPIGLQKPAHAPSVNVGTTVGEYVSDVVIVKGGAGYASEPEVSFVGGDPTTAASGLAVIRNGRVAGVRLTERGKDYQGPPAINFSGGVGSAPSFDVSVSGRVAGVTINSGGDDYTQTPACTASPADEYVYVQYHGLLDGSTVSFFSLTDTTGVTNDTVYYATSVATSRFKITDSLGGTPITISSGITSGGCNIPLPRIEFSTAQGLTAVAATGAHAEVSIANGKVSNVRVLDGGTAATTNGTAVIVGGGGSGAVVTPDMRYQVVSVTAATSGEGYYAAPIITIRNSETDVSGGGAIVESTIDDEGRISGTTVINGGEYSEIPDALILDTSVEATAKMRSSMQGKYFCVVRYIDDTPSQRRGPISSSISDYAEIDIPDGAGSIEWSFTHTAVDDRVHAMELWRSTADQATVLFRVATILKTDPEWTDGYTDTLAEPQLVDNERDGFGILPVTLPSGQINARRMGVPPGNFCVGVMFQDRAWYAVDSTGERPNSLLYSEVDEPESVPPLNELIVQNNVGRSDKIVALVPLGADLLIAQQSHLYKLAYVAQPVIDASITLVGYRGVLNPRCWATMGGVAFLADSYGMYAFDGGAEDPLSVPIDNYWRDGTIDMSKSDQFHLAADFETKTVRFYYCKQADTAPTRALCYCVATRAWWEETYPEAVTASSVASFDNALRTITSSGGMFFREGGVEDPQGPVPYDMLTGNIRLAEERNGGRSLSLTYKPTAEQSLLKLRLHYNGSETPRSNAISSDRGNGVIATAGTDTSIDLQSQRSPLGDSSGVVTVYHSGRVDTRSAGGDRHVAIGFSGTQAGTAASGVVLHGLTMEGAG